MTAGHDETVASSVPAAIGADGPIPELVAERYRIVRWLGGGGMGRVYEALDTELGESIALKVLRSGLADESVERFRREVRLTRRIQHRNVARMFDIGEHRGDKFLTMELVAGDSLARLVTEARLDWPRLRAFAIQICDGLAAAHATGVIHRDLKPDNVLIERGSERVVITDFGIARARDDASVTQLGVVVGTPRYMAPEQLAGADIDPRADLFALGVMLYELACGARPWPGDGAVSIAVAQATQAPRPFHATRMPAELGELVMALLAVERDERPADATGVSARLGAMSAVLPSGPPVRPTPSKVLSAEHVRSPLAAGPQVSVAAGSGLTSAAPAATTLAVLAMASAPADAHLGDVVREELTDTLSTGRLRVRAATAAALAEADPREAGRILGVDVVILGSVRRTATALRVSVRLIGVEDGFQIWANRAECSEGDLFATCEAIARDIALALSTRAIIPAAVRPTDPRAVELYLAARAELRRFWGEHAVIAVGLLEQAAAIAPESASILSTLALARAQAWVRQGDPELLAPARLAVDRALATGHGEAFVASATLALNTGDLATAATHVAYAVARAPMAAATHELIGRLLLELGPIDEARRHLETAIALDATRDSSVNVEIARLEALSGDFEAAARRNERLLADEDPAITQAGAMSTVRLASWRRCYDELFAAVGLFRQRFGTVTTALVAFTRTWVEHRTFDAPEWSRLIDVVLPATTPTRMQMIYLQRATEMALMLEQPVTAFESLEKAVAVGLIDVVWLDRCPLFDGVRHDRHFIAARAIVAARAAGMLSAYRTASSGSPHGGPDRSG